MNKKLMTICVGGLVAVSGAAGVAAASDASHDQGGVGSPDLDRAASETSVDARLSDDEQATFESVEQMLVDAESVPGMIAVGSPSGDTVGYVRTADLMARVSVPLGERSASTVALYDLEGRVIGEWSPHAPDVSGAEPTTGRP